MQMQGRDGRTDWDDEQHLNRHAHAGVDVGLIRADLILRQILHSA